MPADFRRKAHGFNGCRLCRFCREAGRPPLAGINQGKGFQPCPQGRCSRRHFCKPCWSLGRRQNVWKCSFCGNTCKRHLCDDVFSCMPSCLGGSCVFLTTKAQRHEGVLSILSWREKSSTTCACTRRGSRQMLDTILTSLYNHGRLFLGSSIGRAGGC